MCCLFGMIDCHGRFSAREKAHILSVLATECEERGTDATGIAYCTHDHPGKGQQEPKQSSVSGKCRWRDVCAGSQRYSIQ